MQHRTNLTEEQVKYLYDGIHDTYIDHDHHCPNCLNTSYNLSDHSNYDTRVCTKCGYDYYVIGDNTRLL